MQGVPRGFKMSGRSKIGVLAVAAALSAGPGSGSAFGADDPATRVREYLEQRKSINRTYNAQAKAVAGEFGKSLSAHIHRGKPYPKGFIQKFSAVETERNKAIHELGVSRSNAKQKKREIQEKKERKSRVLGSKGSGEKKGKTSSAATPPGGTRKRPGRSSSELFSSGGASGSGIVLEGSNTPSEIDFTGPKKAADKPADSAAE